MPWYLNQDQHNEEEFIALAEKCGIKAIIDQYRALGLVFCYLGVGYDTHYDREPEHVGQPSLKEGIVYIAIPSTNSICRGRKASSYRLCMN